MIFTRHIISSFLVLTTLLPQSSPAQCVRQKLKIDQFRGQVLVESNQAPLAGVLIMLLKEDGELRKLVAEALSDKDGGFAIDGVAAGKYFFEVEAAHFDTIYTDIKVVRAARGKFRSFMSVRLGFPKSGTDSCEGEVIVSRRR